MAEKLDPKEVVPIADLAISSVWETAALMEVLDRKEVCTKQEVLDMIQELRRQNPAADPPTQAFPQPYLDVQVENALIDRIIDLLNAIGFTAHSAKDSQSCERGGGT